MKRLIFLGIGLVALFVSWIGMQLIHPFVTAFAVLFVLFSLQMMADINREIEDERRREEVPGPGPRVVDDEDEYFVRERPSRAQSDDLVVSEQRPDQTVTLSEEEYRDLINRRLRHKKDQLVPRRPRGRRRR